MTKTRDGHKNNLGQLHCQSKLRSILAALMTDIGEDDRLGRVHRERMRKKKKKRGTDLEMFYDKNATREPYLENREKHSSCCSPKLKGSVVCLGKLAYYKPIGKNHPLQTFLVAKAGLHYSYCCFHADLRLV